MTSRTAYKDPISVDDYLAGEQHSEIRHEFINGQVYAMGGASRTHGLIVNALAFVLTPAARRRHCQLFTSDMKVQLQIGNSQIFYYPDLLLSCDPNDRETYFCRTPCLIIEVLSESTERIDRREKFLAYQALPSLQEYLLVAQDARRVEIYRRSTDWQVECYESGQVQLDCLEERLDLDSIYQDVEMTG
ncbi:MAG: hypothetical protein A2286_03860 [Gammaproteobacteria bacterium RIFOXYA12_FULL_61_12]|nr:MAG: hypothetical protein A2514_07220 [Gammaproteobacteria bacterium RIFOXYD12_FULL_61_37]OGT94426.1 MAG: hypothetical protein A2286_03860 [Gammaproteobacteria bacterium RIFOXYA12_FULL_61_12]